MKKTLLIGTLLSSFLLVKTTPVQAQLKIDPQPYIGTSGTSSGPVIVPSPYYVVIGGTTQIPGKPLTIYSSGDARIAFVETSQAADNTKWLLGPSGLTFLGKTLDDANNITRTWLSVTRSGTSISSIVFATNTGTTALTINSSQQVTLAASLLSSGTTSDIGSVANPFEYIYIKPSGSGAVRFGAAGSPQIYADGTTGIIVDSAKTSFITGPIALGATPPATGAIRLTNANIIKGNVAAGNLDTQIIGIDSSNITQVGDASFTTNLNGPVTFSSFVTKYAGVNTAGLGIPSIVAQARFTGQVAAKASVATYTVGAADGTFEISANVLATTSTTYNFNVTVSYNDEANTARTLTLPFSNSASISGTITNTTGPSFVGVTQTIRCKAATAITIATSGTFTTVTYNVDGTIKQIS